MICLDFFVFICTLRTYPIVTLLLIRYEVSIKQSIRDKCVVEGLEHFQSDISADRL